MHIKKLRFTVLAPEYVKKKLSDINIPGLSYTVSGSGTDTVLEVKYSEKENYSLFMAKTPDILNFFYIDCLSNSVASLVSAQLYEKKVKLVTVESCTGGMIGKMITDISGSSQWYWGGYITYDNKAKIMLGVDPDVIKTYGAVSRETCELMAAAGLSKSDADISIAVSGIAGPGGGSMEKPVGTVWTSLKSRRSGLNKSAGFVFSGTRAVIRKKAAKASLLMVYRELLNKPGVDSNLFEDYI